MEVLKQKNKKMKENTAHIVQKEISCVPYFLPGSKDLEETEPNVLPIDPP